MNTCPSIFQSISLQKILDIYFSFFLFSFSSLAQRPNDHLHGHLLLDETSRWCINSIGTATVVRYGIIMFLSLLSRCISSEIERLSEGRKRSWYTGKGKERWVCSYSTYRVDSRCYNCRQVNIFRILSQCWYNISILKNLIKAKIQIFS